MLTGLSDKASASNQHTLVIFDDVYQVAASKVFEPRHFGPTSETTSAGPEALKHNLYQQSTNSKTIDLNVTQLLLLRNPRDTNQIDYLGRQLGCRELLLNSYKRATQDEFGHLLIDLDPRLNENLRFSSNIVSKPAIYYCNTSNSTAINIDDSFTTSLYN